MFPDFSGLLSGITKQLPLPGRLTIIPLLKVSPVPIPAPLPPFIAQFNPETFTEATEYLHFKPAPPGKSSSDQKFNKIKPRQLDFELLIDGTGASGEKREVQAEIVHLKKLTKVVGPLHEPYKLLLIWGTYFVTAVIDNIDITYTLFRKNGTPLRATVKLKLSEHEEQVFSILKSALESPDLTTSRKVDAGDNLPLMCNKIYDHPRYYLEVAKANGLTNFRRIKPGKTLDFPPVKKEKTLNR